MPECKEKMLVLKGSSVQMDETLDRLFLAKRNKPGTHDLDFEPIYQHFKDLLDTYGAATRYVTTDTTTGQAEERTIKYLGKVFCKSRAPRRKLHLDLSHTQSAKLSIVELKLVSVKEGKTVWYFLAPDRISFSCITPRKLSFFQCPHPNETSETGFFYKPEEAPLDALLLLYYRLHDTFSYTSQAPENNTFMQQILSIPRKILSLCN